MKNQAIQTFIIVIITALATYFITKSTVKPQKVSVTRTDTVLVKADTVLKDRPFAVKLPGKIDTVFFADTVKSIIARADTLIRKDSSYVRVSYYFPPENYFDVDLNIKEHVVTLTREVMKEVKVENPWYDHFWTGAASVMAVIISIILLLK